MRFLVDESLSWVLARDLKRAGYDTVHARDVGLLHAKDKDLLDHALQNHRTIITQDSDFGTLLAERRTAAPSVVLFRVRDGRPDFQVELLLAHLPMVEEAITKGAIIVLGDGLIRVRRLPIGT